MAEGGSDVRDLTIVVKYAGKEYPVAVTSEDTVAVLRHEISKLTEVMPKRQKLINLKYLDKPAGDDVKLGLIHFKPNYRLMMIGSTEKAIEDAKKLPDDIAEISDDFDWEADENTFATSTIYLAKVQRRIRDYRIKELNPSREGKKLLVLDIDYTLFDHRSVGQDIRDLTRPYLHEFMTAAYQNYDIVMWSATGMRWIDQKMNMLGCTANPNYKIWFYLDSHACISINAHLTLNHQGIFDTKPLGVIWGKYPKYSAKNTIHIDDIKRNFLMNPQSGLKIKSFRNSVWFKEEDTELLKLSIYLSNIAVHCEDFRTLNHDEWQRYLPPREEPPSEEPPTEEPSSEE